jgi:hypothetical protein
MHSAVFQGEDVHPSQRPPEKKHQFEFFFYNSYKDYLTIKKKQFSR